MKSFKIDGVLFELNYSYGQYKQLNHKLFFKTDNVKSLFIIPKIIYYTFKSYKIFSVNNILYFENKFLMLEGNQIISQSDGSFFQGSVDFNFSKKDILYYSSNLDLIIKKVESLNLLS